MGKEAASATGPQFPFWYKNAIVYQLHVCSFFDSAGDGVGDFRGLTQKLDYVHDLGVTAIWLLPFFPSPMHDDGYDIADFTNVEAAYGTLRDFKNFVRQAHRRDLRVMIELVLPHTSGDHPWFQRACRAAPGSRWRNFYIWRSESSADSGAFRGWSDETNWHWEPTAEAYYWHRFGPHWPQLNYDSPQVRQAVTGVLDFWMKQGVDGFRLDGVPYLFDHPVAGDGRPDDSQVQQRAAEFLSSLRDHVESEFPGRVLLAESHKWPEDSAGGEPAHMAYHFALIPSLFRSLEREDRFPVVEALQEAPDEEARTQWVLFLRSHAEPVLEAVAQQEQDSLLPLHGPHIQRWDHTGVRRRLAPLLGNNRRKIELMHGLLFSLPGTPVIYYGDEIGMGDNIYLGDRNSVRTPMQWSPDRNAGFSQANPQKLHLPVVIDSEFHFETRNVETLHNNPDSLLWWTKHLINLRKRYEAFGRGSLEFLAPENGKVLAFIRRFGEENLLVVANLSRFAQYLELNLRPFQGCVPVELFGHTQFPEIGDLPYFLTLGPHVFYWFKLERQDAAPERFSQEELPSARIEGEWNNVFRGQSKTAVQNALPKFLQNQPWFLGATRRIQWTKIQDVIPLAGRSSQTRFWLAVVRVDYVDGEPETYLLPLSMATETHAERLLTDHPASALMLVESRDAHHAGILYEATSEPNWWKTLWRAFNRKQRTTSSEGELDAFHTASFRQQRRQISQSPEPAIHWTKTTNNFVIYGERYFLKIFRCLSAGVDPDLEINRFLTENTALSAPSQDRKTGVIPRLAGALEYRKGRAEPQTLAIVHEYQPNEGNAWDFTLDELSRFLERVGSQTTENRPHDDLLPADTPVELLEKPVPSRAEEMVGGYREAIELLGRRTAELHTALASAGENSDFVPEPFSTFYQRSLYQAMRTASLQTFRLLRRRMKDLSEPAAEAAENVLAREADILDFYRGVLEGKITTLRQRCHGDYHLGQVLFTGKDFVIVDFAGETGRPVGERRIKRSALRDIAGMVRSMHYAAWAARFGQVPGAMLPPETHVHTESWLRCWYLWTTAAFLNGYLAQADDAEFLPRSRQEFRDLLHAYLLRTSMGDLKYELDQRSEWIRVPLSAILQVMDAVG